MAGVWENAPENLFHLEKYSAKRSVFCGGLKKKTKTLTKLGLSVNRFCNDLKHQMFSVYSTLEKLENATITGHFGFVFKENSGGEVTT